MAMITSSANDPQLSEFADKFNPLEPKEGLLTLSDRRTGAKFCECHIKASILVPLATTSVPLDPETQPEYKANRDIRTDHKAFIKMKEDALKGRAFSNIVAEYITDFAPEFPLKIVGGQHRFEAIQHALQAGIDEYHGIKVYFNLNKEQRMDVQLISNTTIAVSSALIDRMIETAKGADLRAWAQKTGILAAKKDFADQPTRGSITIRLVRSFIVNYYRGKNIADFENAQTMPVLCASGVESDPEWTTLIDVSPELWKDDKLIEAGKQYALLIAAQKKAFAGQKGIKADYPVKALNLAVTAAWAFVAGSLENNPTRLQRHFELRDEARHDPLDASSLAQGRFKSDSANYRGLGYRTDAKERGRLAEVFYMQAEKGKGLSLALIQNAIRKYEMKVIQLDMDEDE
jgi:hypothetical protein